MASLTDRVRLSSGPNGSSQGRSALPWDRPGPRATPPWQGRSSTPAGPAPDTAGLKGPAPRPHDQGRGPVLPPAELPPVRDCRLGLPAPAGIVPVWDASVGLCPSPPERHQRRDQHLGWPREAPPGPCRCWRPQSAGQPAGRLGQHREPSGVIRRTPSLGGRRPRKPLAARKKPAATHNSPLLAGAAGPCALRGAPVQP